MQIFEEYLQLDSSYKEMIQAMVVHHGTQTTSDEALVQDLVENKGQGLVLLLHGMTLYINK